MKIVVLVVATFVMVVTSVLIYWSPGRASPIVDDRGHPVPGSLSEKVRVPINGAAYDQALDNIAAIEKWADG